MSSEETATADTTSGSSGGGTSKIVVIASLVNMVATIGIVAVLFLAHQKEKSKPTVEDIVSGQAQSGHGSSAGGAKAEGGQGDAKGEHGSGSEAGSGAAAVNDSGKILPLEPFTVNLTTGVGTQPRYVRMNISMELEQGVPEKEFDIKLPRIRDTIINLLNSKKASEINAVDGREQLKEEIRRSVNSFMLQSKVKGVYFTNFAVSN